MLKLSFRAFALACAICLCSLDSYAGDSVLDDQEASSAASASAAYPHSSSQDVSDAFDFLRASYPHLVDKASEEYKPQGDDNPATYIDEFGLPKMSDYAIGRLSLKTAQLGVPEYVGNPNAPQKFRTFCEQLKLMQSLHPFRAFYGVYFSRMMAPDTRNFERIPLVAEYIYQLVSERGPGNILYLGRSPYSVFMAHEMLVERLQKGESPKHILFSGFPDMPHTRTVCKDRTAESLELEFVEGSDREESIVENMLTQDKVRHFFAYLDSKGLSPEKPVYLVDFTDSGSSLRAFVRILNGYYCQKGWAAPAITFLNIVPICSENPMFKLIPGSWPISEKPAPRRGKKKPWSNKFDLTLKPVPGVFQEQTISEYRIIVPQLLLMQFFDADVVQHQLPVCKYPAQAWTESYDHVRDNAKSCDPNERLMGYLKVAFERFIQEHISLANHK